MQIWSNHSNLKVIIQIIFEIATLLHLSLKGVTSDDFSEHRFNKEAFLKAEFYSWREMREGNDVSGRSVGIMVEVRSDGVLIELRESISQLCVGAVDGARFLGVDDVRWPGAEGEVTPFPIEGNGLFDG